VGRTPAVVPIARALGCVERVGHRKPRAVDAPLVERYSAEQPELRPHGEAGLERQELVHREPRVRLAPLERLVTIVGFKERVDELQAHRAENPPPHRHQEGDPEQEVRRDGLDMTRVFA
jgi:hypothetical protein